MMSIFTLSCFADECFIETFDDSLTENWMVVSKNGTINTDGNCLNIQIPYASETAGDAFVQTLNTVNGTDDFLLGFGMEMTSQSGIGQVLLRDTNSSVDGHSISVAKMQNGKIYYLPELLGETVYDNVSAGKMCYLQIRFEFRGRKITVYNNGEQKAQVQNLTSVNDGYWRAFNWNEFYIRLYAARSESADVGVEFDDFVIHKLYSNVCMDEKFEKNDFADWNIVKKQGEIERTDSGVVKVTLPASGSGSNDALLQTKKIIDGSSGFVLEADMRLDSSEGIAQIALRDTNSSVDGHSITLAKIEDGFLYYLPELKNNTAKERINTGALARIKVIVDLATDSITVYRNGSEKAMQTSLKSTGAGKTFEWQNFYLRLYAAKFGAETEFDNIKLMTRTDYYRCLSGKGLILSGDKLRYDQKYINIDNLINPMQIMMAVRNADGSLISTGKGMTSDGTRYKAQDISVEVPYSDISESDRIDIFTWRDIITLKPQDIKKSITVNGEKAVKPYAPDKNEIAVSLNTQHPRIFANNDEFDALRNTIKNNSNSDQAKWYSSIKKRAKSYLSMPLPQYQQTPTSTSQNLRASAQAVLSRVSEMALVYKIDGEKEYADKIWEYLNACAKWQDWGDILFLNTAEISAAYAIAYDWLYDTWSEQQKAVIKNALIEKNFRIANKLFNTGTDWTQQDANWIAVCDGGIIMAATALMGDYDDSSDILVKSIDNLRRCYVQFLPDGGWSEGTSYWSYGMKFLSMAFACMDSAYGTDFSHANATAMDRSIVFPLYMSGRSTNYSFGDSPQNGLVDCGCLFYFGKRFKNTGVNAYRKYQLNELGAEPGIMDVLFYDDKNTPSEVTDLSGSMIYTGYRTAVFRNGFDKNTKSAAIMHADSNTVSHAQLDIGQFVYENDGVSWAVDLGSDSYSLNYMGYTTGEKNKWAYYRNRAEGHNTWVINPDSQPDQKISASGQIEKYKTSDDADMIVFDNSEAYSDDARSVRRGMYYTRANGGLVIRDELKLNVGSELYWFMHTKASVKISDDKKSAILIQKNNAGEEKRLWIGIVDGSGEFLQMSATPLPTSPNPDEWSENIEDGKVQNANKGVSKLAIHYTNSAAEIGQTVYMVPLEDGQSTPNEYPNILTLNQW